MALLFSFFYISISVPSIPRTNDIIHKLDFSSNSGTFDTISINTQSTTLLIDNVPNSTTIALIGRSIVISKEIQKNTKIGYTILPNLNFTMNITVCDSVTLFLYNKFTSSISYKTQMNFIL